MLLARFAFAPLARFAWMWAYWSLVLILLGLRFLVRDRIAPDARRPLACAVGATIAVYALVAVGTVIALGSLLLAANLGWFDAYWSRLLWPLILVAVGLVLLTARGRGLGAPHP
jgi:hypothetical protein